jgi:hypothetical protein
LGFLFIPFYLTFIRFAKADNPNAFGGFGKHQRMHPTRHQ